MSNPLNFTQSDSALRQQRIETKIIYPRTINDNESGGTCRFVIPHEGFLSANTCITLPATCQAKNFQYAPNAGVYSLLKTARMRIGDQVITEVNNVGQYLAQRVLRNSQEKREGMNRVKEGIHYSYECASGSRRSEVSAEIEILQGQERLVAEEYLQRLGSKSLPGPELALSCMMDAKQDDAYMLQTTEDDTPEFFIYLKDLFSNYFNSGRGLELPLQLINKDEEICIELEFSDDGGLSTNERAVYLPSLAENDRTGAVAVVLSTVENNRNSATAVSDITVQHSGNGIEEKKGFVVRFNLSNSNTAVPEQIKVLSQGKGYEAEKDYAIVYDGRTFNFRVPHQCTSLRSGSSSNFFIVAGGTGYTTDDDANTTIENVDNRKVEPNIVATISAGGAVTAVKFKTEDDRRKFLFDPLRTYKVKGGNNDAEVRAFKELNTCTGTASGAGLSVGDEIVGTAADSNFKGIIKTITGADITSFYVIQGSIESGEEVEEETSGITQTLTVVTKSDDTNAYVNAVPILGSAGQYAFDDYTRKIKVAKDKVQMLCDIVYYEDDTVAQMEAQLQKGGITQLYTELRNITSSCSQDNQSGYGGKSDKLQTRLIGFSNEVLRNLYIQASPSTSTQDNIDFPDYELPRKNALLGFYCARDSLAEKGVKLNVVVNSVPFFNSPVEFNPQFYDEYAQCNDKPLYIPQGAYCGWTSAKQQDNESQANNSKQPAFSRIYTDIDGVGSASLQFERNERCQGIVNQLYGGVSQSNLVGMNNYIGVSFKKTPMNVQGNGVRVGSAPVEVQYEYSATYDPMFNGNYNLNMYGEVERLFILDSAGRVAVTNGSF